jgi:hypothetical protein
LNKFGQYSVSIFPFSIFARVMSHEKIIRKKFIYSKIFNFTVVIFKTDFDKINSFAQENIKLSRIEKTFSKDYYAFKAICFFKRYFTIFHIYIASALLLLSVFVGDS